MKKYRFYVSGYVDIMADNEESAKDKFFEEDHKVNYTEQYDYIEEDPDNECENN